MRVFNTGTANFWTSVIGEQLRLLRLTDQRYHLAGIDAKALIEQVAHKALPVCNRWGLWPLITVRGMSVVFSWRARGEISVALDGTQVSYVPDPIRRSGTVAMVFMVNASNPGMEKFLRGAFWHLLEVRP